MSIASAILESGSATLKLIATPKQGPDTEDLATSYGGATVYQYIQHSMSKLIRAVFKVIYLKLGMVDTCAVPDCKSNKKSSFKSNGYI